MPQSVHEILSGFRPSLREWALFSGLLALALGGLAALAPLVLGQALLPFLGLVILAGSLLESPRWFGPADRPRRTALFVGAWTSLVVGMLLLIRPMLVLGGLIILLAGSLAFDGAWRLWTAWREEGRPARARDFAYGLLQLAMATFLALQWPVSGTTVFAAIVGLRLASLGVSLLTSAVVRTAPAETRRQDDADLAAALGLPAHAETERLVASVTASEKSRRAVDVYWYLAFLATFFAIHVGRMSVSWDLVGLLGPAVAVAGDVLTSLGVAFAVVTPTLFGWRGLTRPLERWGWRRLLASHDGNQPPRWYQLALRGWLTRRLRSEWAAQLAFRSPLDALRRGMHLGLPLVAVLVATNPIWGFSWYFNSENWAAEVWHHWAAERTDTWRTNMVRAAVSGMARRTIPLDSPLADAPSGLEQDFSFIVLGDPGEGDGSQHALRDQYLELGRESRIRFLVISSDVVYPAGAMSDYESHFYLPLKGFHKPVYALPGNHDWYDALEGFTANFFDPPAARRAIGARVDADYGLTTTTADRIAADVAEAARLRRSYGVRTGLQRSPYFAFNSSRFALIVVDTGIDRQIDGDQRAWLEQRLEQSAGKFVMVLIGHPLFAAGRLQSRSSDSLGELHRLFKRYQVPLVMAGDTHDFEYYREEYAARGRQVMHHVVNGGGGAYLSIGTALDWPTVPDTATTAIYPGRAAIVAKLDQQTPAWKRPLWYWVKRWKAWPSTPEAISAIFDFNRAPFFQSFVEVAVEYSQQRVRLLVYGVHGRLRWRDLEIRGAVVPGAAKPDDFVEFTIPLDSAAGRRVP